MGGVGGICQGVAAITVAARPRITQRPSLLNFPVREREKFGRVWKRDAIEKELMQMRDAGEEEEEEGRNNLKIHNQRAESRSSSSS
jgi:hypothetical protein